MFGFFKKNSANEDEGRIPAPIAGRDGHLAAIESLTLDGVMYFFGFDFGNDLVVSPLIPDIDVMARFASRHMRQRDGMHDEAYWRELAGYAVDDSELCSDAAGRMFSSQSLARMMERLAHARSTNTLAPDIAIPYHLQYLLGAAGGWAVDGDEVTSGIAYVTGEEPLPQGATAAQVVEWLQTLLTKLANAAPENWSASFGALKGS
jgi:hypothetical protein